MLLLGDDLDRSAVNTPAQCTGYKYGAEQHSDRCKCTWLPAGSCRPRPLRFGIEAPLGCLGVPKPASGFADYQNLPLTALLKKLQYEPLGSQTTKRA